MKNISCFSLISGIIALLCSCNSGDSTTRENVYNSTTGIGKFEKFSVTGDHLDSVLIAKGDEFFSSKCSACHLLTAEDSNGPGWFGITSKRSPAWLMNMMTNTEEMIELDPSLNGRLKKYKSTMPDYQLTKDEARAILEFMRYNDSGENDREREETEQCHYTSRRK